MDLTHPMQSVIPSAHGAVLGVLARTTEPLSGRQVAELTRPKFGQSRVNHVLQNLAEAGVVLRESRPPSFHYRLNREHVAADGIISLTDLWSTLMARIKTELSTWTDPADAAWMFGSAARREAGPESDIDILLLRSDQSSGGGDTSPTWLRQTNDLIEHVRMWSGNPCEVLEMTTSELSAAVSRDDELVRDLRDHAVVLTGSAPRLLLRSLAR